MAKCTVKLLKLERWLDKPSGEARLVAFAHRELRTGGYNDSPVINIETDVMITGEAAAEEIFDLTNNPSRHDERDQVYGQWRNVCSGDIVTVDGIDFLCLSIGWKQI